MEYKFEVDEARILKLVMDGISKKEIEESIANDIKRSIKEKIRARVLSNIESIVGKYCDNEFKKSLVEGIKSDLKKTLTPQNIAKEFKKEQWESLFGEVAQQTIVNFIDYALSEWLTLNIVVSGGNKQKNISVVGTESYQYRKK